MQPTKFSDPQLSGYGCWDEREGSSMTESPMRGNPGSASNPRNPSNSWRLAYPRTAWLALLVLTSVPAAHADAVSKARKVGELLAAMHMEETTTRLEQAEEERIDSLSRQQLAGVTLQPDQQRSYDEFRHKVLDLLRASETWKALEPDFVKLYSDAYTEDEIDGILAFYRTPVGRAMLAKTPELTEQSIAISQRRTAQLAPQIQKLVEQFQREMQ